MSHGQNFLKGDDIRVVWSPDYRVTRLQIRSFDDSSCEVSSAAETKGTVFLVTAAADDVYAYTSTGPICVFWGLFWPCSEPTPPKPRYFEVWHHTVHKHVHLRLHRHLHMHVHVHVHIRSGSDYDGLAKNLLAPKSSRVPGLVLPSF